jgi:hypothetical protein
LIGGVVGGAVAALLLIGALVFVACRRRKSAPAAAAANAGSDGASGKQHEDNYAAISLPRSSGVTDYVSNEHENYVQIQMPQQNGDATNNYAVGDVEVADVEETEYSVIPQLRGIQSKTTGVETNYGAL